MIITRSHQASSPCSPIKIRTSPPTITHLAASAYDTGIDSPPHSPSAKTPQTASQRTRKKILASLTDSKEFAAAMSSEELGKSWDEESCDEVSERSTYTVLR